MLFSWIDNKLGRLPADDRASVIEEEENALEKALSARAARRVADTARKCSAAKTVKTRLLRRKKAHRKFRRAASAGIII